VRIAKLLRVPDFMLFSTLRTDLSILMVVSLDISVLNHSRQIARVVLESLVCPVAVFLASRCAEIGQFKRCLISVLHARVLLFKMLLIVARPSLQSCSIRWLAILVECA